MSRLEEDITPPYISTPNLPFNQNLITHYLLCNTDDCTPKVKAVIQKFEREVLKDPRNLSILFQLSFSKRQHMTRIIRDILQFMSNKSNFDINQPFKLDEETLLYVKSKYSNKDRATKQLFNNALDYLKKFFIYCYDGQDIDLNSFNYERHCDKLDPTALENENCVFDKNLIGQYTLKMDSDDSPKVKKLVDQFETEILGNVLVLNEIFGYNYRRRTDCIWSWKSMLRTMAEKPYYDFNKGVHLDKDYLMTQLNRNKGSMINAYNALSTVLEIAYSNPARLTAEARAVETRAAIARLTLAEIRVAESRLAAVQAIELEAETARAAANAADAAMLAKKARESATMVREASEASEARLKALAETGITVNALQSDHQNLAVSTSQVDMESNINVEAIYSSNLNATVDHFNQELKTTIDILIEKCLKNEDEITQESLTSNIDSIISTFFQDIKRFMSTQNLTSN
ncbi:uncharacterized protein KGF55_003778 [Candida pseudojiufengensis]|uniref:uncharacterized protein n=1 Tax=Candida pseudojiufengensis TaxID=497109 RepID=UPI0022240B6E|nr:uncharacterized protein KGF55_003778 [Candida pseudojiufengensis]KAI5962702.1 hypothetical protein KGF55_003778 [Candida pseudojiufengensis]